MTAATADQSSDSAERFTHADLDCRIVKTDAEQWYGYVRRPEDVEPVDWWGGYDPEHGEMLEAEVDVWGGITYGPGEDGWVGFDDAHPESLVDHRDAETSREAVKNETESLAEQIQSLRTGGERDAQ